MPQAPDDLVARATDPNAELTTLHELAQHYPGLRPYIAANPRTYPALLEWLGALGDPAIDAALAQREGSSAQEAPNSLESSTLREGSVPDLQAVSTPSRQPAIPPLSRQSPTSPQPAGPASFEPAALEPAATQPASFEPTAFEPATAQPASFEPSGGQETVEPQEPPSRRPLSDRRTQPSAVPLAGPDGQAPVTPAPSDFETSSTEAIVDTAVPGSPASFAPAASPSGAAAPVQRVSLTNSTQMTQMQSPYALHPAGQPPAQTSTYQGVTPQPSPAQSSSWSPSAVPAAGGAVAADDQNVFGVGSYDPQEEVRRGGGPLLWGLAAVALVLVIAVVVWFMTSGKDETPPAAGSTPSHAAQTTAAGAQDAKPSAPASSATPSASASPSAALVRPAPDGATQLDGFATPSGNIVCQLTETGTSCTITQYSFIPTDPSCNNTNTSPFTVTVGTDGSVSGSCSAGAPAAPTTLNYGGAAHNGGFACESRESGVECWNEQTGKGFTLSRDAADNKP